MQNDFVREGAPQEVPAARATIPAIASLLEAYRGAGRPDYVYPLHRRAEAHAALAMVTGVRPGAALLLAR